MGIVDIRKSSKGTLNTKLNGLRISLKLCEDGSWQSWPKGILSYLPIIEKQITRLRIRFALYSGEKVLIMESRYPDNVNQQIVGGICEEAQIPETFRNACGSYELANERLNDVKGSCLLRIEKGVLMLRLCFLGGTMRYALKAVDNSLAFVQGFGRNSGNDVRLTEKNGVQYLSSCGLVFQKVMKK